MKPHIFRDLGHWVVRCHNGVIMGAVSNVREFAPYWPLIDGTAVA